MGVLWFAADVIFCGVAAVVIFRIFKSTALIGTKENEKKALMITNTASMVHLFNEDNIRIMTDLGYEVHIACNFHSGNTISKDMIKACAAEWRKKGIILHEIDFIRTPFSLKNIKVYKQTKSLIKKEKFSLIHCHSPLVAAFVRIAARKERKRGARVIYTAHGFHFYKGCPKINWLVYYSIEKMLAPYTDVIITINEEDYVRAKRHLKAKAVYHINGIGIDVRRIASAEKSGIREKLGIDGEDIILLSVGELNENKNHSVIIKALAQCTNKKLHYIIAGIGNMKNELLTLAQELGIADRIHILGFSSNVYNILMDCDVFVFPSKREGLPVALMEAMAAGLPVIASKVRGNIDLIDDGLGGILCDASDAASFSKAIDKISFDELSKKRMGEYNCNKIKDYDKIVINEQMRHILSNESAEHRSEHMIKSIV